MPRYRIRFLERIEHEVEVELPREIYPGEWAEIADKASYRWQRVGSIQDLELIEIEEVKR